MSPQMFLQPRIRIENPIPSLVVDALSFPGGALLRIQNNKRMTYGESGSQFKFGWIEFYLSKRSSIAFSGLVFVILKR
jgi:hypothetical protein